MKTKDLTITEVENYIDSLEEKIRKLEQQVSEYRNSAAQSNQTWEELLRLEVRQLMFEKNDAIKNIGETAERILIKTALECNSNKRQETAKILGYGRNTITKKVTELDIDLDIDLGL